MEIKKLTDATIKTKYIVVGTNDINMWTDSEPFIIGLDTKKDFDKNGLDYDEYSDMKISEVKVANDGVLVIRIR